MTLIFARMKSTQNTIISHIRDFDKAIQTNEEHSSGVAKLAESFANEFGMGDWGKMLGLLHDKGKERKDFQNYIRRENGIEAPPYGDKTHAWIGAQLAKRLMPKFYPMATFPILGHHAGMCDYTSLKEYMEKEIPSEVDCNMGFNEPPMDFFVKNNLLSLDKQKFIHHVERMLFSCLVDADFLDTERFMQPDKYEMRKSSTSLLELLPKLEEYLSKFKSDPPVNNIRKQIQDCCRNSASKPCGVYSLT
ncbi:MAG: CRISPR-associated endonuclease Cas3'', partial [Bacteroidales bacterium]|nr:CRISPR-associated endonuclease Cas3'' [Bacteroidales bacterium]